MLDVAFSLLMIVDQKEAVLADSVKHRLQVCSCTCCGWLATGCWPLSPSPSLSSFILPRPRAGGGDVMFRIYNIVSSRAKQTYGATTQAENSKIFHCFCLCPTFPEQRDCVLDKLHEELLAHEDEDHLHRQLHEAAAGGALLLVTDRSIRSITYHCLHLPVCPQTVCCSHQGCRQSCP